MLVQCFLPVASMVLRQAKNLRLTILVGLFQHSHVSMRIVQPNGLISSNATYRISSIFSLSGYEAREHPFKERTRAVMALKDVPISAALAKSYSALQPARSQNLVDVPRNDQSLHKMRYVALPNISSSE